MERRHDKNDESGVGRSAATSTLRKLAAFRRITLVRPELRSASVALCVPMSQYTFVNHTGTHVDAPAHQIAGGGSLDEIPLDRLMTHAVIADVSDHEPGPVGPADLSGCLQQVSPGELVLFRSGNAQNWGTDEYWHGWCYPDAQAAQALIDRDVAGVGFDGASADPVDTDD